MALRSLDVLGLRGFATKQTLSFAKPSGNKGSGLTIIVGANNAGKSTCIEALRAIAQSEAPSFTQGRRNQIAGDQVHIAVSDTDGRVTELKSIRPGSSETAFKRYGDGIDIKKLFILPSRRVFNPYFGRSELSRDQYMNQIGFPASRANTINEFAYRLFKVEKNIDSFNSVLSKIINPVPEWSIDQMDNGNYFLKIRKGGATHSSEGMGEGLVSLMYIIYALYDSSPGDTIAIDEPELSLHPALQRKLVALFVEYSATRQFIVATHSPYFAELTALEAGGTVARVQIVDKSSRISQLSADTAKIFRGLLSNKNNPHIFGLNAQEVFFTEDRIILVEGQEDVVFYKYILDKLGIEIAATFFGWGVGGADNMRKIAKVLQELGFSRVAGILDANRADMTQQLNHEFPDYFFTAIAADDVRSKPEAKARPSVKGLLDDANSDIRPEFCNDTSELFDNVRLYLDS